MKCSKVEAPPACSKSDTKSTTFGFCSKSDVRFTSLYRQRACSFCDSRIVSFYLPLGVSFYQVSQRRHRQWVNIGQCKQFYRQFLHSVPQEWLTLQPPSFDLDNRTSLGYLGKLGEGLFGQYGCSRLITLTLRLRPKNSSVAAGYLCG